MATNPPEDTVIGEKEPASPGYSIAGLPEGPKDPLNEPGAELCAKLGLTRDLEIKALPKGYIFTNITVFTNETQKTFEELTRIIKENNGFVLDTAWTGLGRIGVRCAMPNVGSIQDVVGNFGTKAEAEHNPLQTIGITTYKGRILPLNIKRDLSDQAPSIPELNPTPASIAHAKTIKGVAPEVTVKTALITAKFPDKTFTVELATQLMDDLAKPEKQFFSFDPKDNTLRIVVDGECPAGNIGQRLAGILAYIKEMGIEVELNSAKCQLVKLGDDTYSFQLSASETQRRTRKVYETEAFRSLRDNERDNSLAIWNSDSKTGEISDIQPVYFEAIVGGPRETVGREDELKILKNDIDTLEKSRRSNVMTVIGPRGSGKTRLVRDVIQYAAKKGVPTAYYKIPEDTRTISGSTIKRLIQAVLQKSPDLTSEFKDLEFYASGVIPDGLRAQYQMQVAALNDENRLTDRFIRLVRNTCALRPLYVALDDIQWIDPFSKTILDKWKERIKEDDNVALHMLARDDEGMTDMPEDRKLNIGPFRYTGQFAYVKRYIETSLPEDWGDVTVPEGLIQRFIDLTGGLPLDITSVLTHLIEEGHIKFEQGKLTFSEPDITNLEKRPQGQTLMSSVTQARFSRLSERARETADWLMICGEIDKNVFLNVLSANSYTPQDIDDVLEELHSRGIITLQPFGFSFDAIPEERKRQYVGREQELSSLASQCYNCLKSEKIKPIDLFKILQIALTNPSDLTKTERQDLQKAYFETSQAALDFCLQTNDNRSAVDICKLVDGKLSGLLESAKTTPQAREACARFLNTLHLKTAQACFRLGDVKATKEHIKKIDDVCEQIPECQFRTGVASLPYYFLQAELACNILRLSRTTSPEDIEAKAQECEAYTGQLENIIKLEEGSGGETPQTRLAKAKIALLRIKIEAGRRIVDAEVIEAQSKLASNLLENMPADLDLETRSLDLEIQRSKSQAKLTALILKTPGRDQESKLMHPITNTAEADGIIASFAAVKGACDRDSRLVLDSLGYCYISDALARLLYMTQRQSEAEKAIGQGILTAIKFGSPEVVSRLRKLQGDMLVYGELKNSFTDSSKWNAKVLSNAVQSYEQGMAEMALVNPDAQYVHFNALNRGRAFAMQLIAKSDAEESPQRIKIFNVFTDTCKALKYLKDRDRKTYLDELLTLGLLAEATDDASILKLPEDITTRDLREAITLSSESSDQTGYTQYDRGFANLRSLGAKGIAEKLLEAA